MKYDDASWHYGGDFPPDLPAEAGATHSGMFLAWALLNGLGGKFFEEEAPEAISELKDRRSTPGAVFLSYSDGKLTDSDLGELGNAFARHYFDLQKGAYLGDYERTLAGGLASTYHVPDTWESYDRLCPVIDRRYAEWRSMRR
jgi:hypothetical protein